MDSIGDILYILFIIAIGIFQLYRKQMKKNAERQVRPVEREEGEKSNPLEDIFGEIFAGTESEEKSEAPDTMETGQGYYAPETEQIPETTKAESQNLAMEEMTKRKSKLWEETAAPELEVEEREGLDFDLRKAVIYTAIMNPKFKEL